MGDGDDLYFISNDLIDHRVWEFSNSASACAFTCGMPGSGIFRNFRESQLCFVNESDCELRPYQLVIMGRCIQLSFRNRLKSTIHFNIFARSRLNTSFAGRDFTFPLRLASTRRSISSTHSASNRNCSWSSRLASSISASNARSSRDNAMAACSTLWNVFVMRIFPCTGF